MPASHQLELTSVTALRWFADTGQSNKSAVEFERTVHALLVVSEALSVLAELSARLRRNVYLDAARLRAHRNALRVRRVSFSNPFELVVEIVNVLPQVGIAAASIGTLLLTGSAVRRKLNAEARKANAEADAVEYEQIQRVARDFFEQSFSLGPLSPSGRRELDQAEKLELQAAWIDVADFIEPQSPNETQVIGILRRDGELRKALLRLREQGFTVVVVDESTDSGTR